MITWLKDLLYNEAAFLSFARLVVIMLGEALRDGLIPTGIDNGGKALGPLLVMLSAFLTKNSTSSK